MLDAHPDLAIPPETHFIPTVAQACGSPARRRGGGRDPRACVLETLTSGPRWPDFGIDRDALTRRVGELEPFTLGGALRSFYGLYAARFGKPRWGDKTPKYVVRMPLIRRLLPEARFVHLVRDGRDVWLSVRGLSFGPGSVETAATAWGSRIAQARAQAHGLPFYSEVRYEDLVLEPEATLRRICEFVDLPWDPAMLDYHARAGERLAELGDIFSPNAGRVIGGADRRRVHALTEAPPQPGRVGRWRTEMDGTERERYESIAGPLLRELGYELG